MDTERMILAAMSPAGGGQYSPVQIQKLLFLIDRELSDLVGGQHFAFQPYHYGPYDKRVYLMLEELAAQGHVTIGVHLVGCRSYALTPEGLESGRDTLENLESRAQNFIKRASNFARENTFSDLVSAIYKAYPEMQENSVFQHI